MANSRSMDAEMPLYAESATSSKKIVSTLLAPDEKGTYSRKDCQSRSIAKNLLREEIYD